MSKGLLSGRWTKSGEKGEIWNDVKYYYEEHRWICRTPLWFKCYHYGVPQNRPRVLLVGIRDDIANCPSSDCPDDAIEAEILPDKNGQMAPHLDELHI